MEMAARQTACWSLASDVWKMFLSYSQFAGANAAMEPYPFLMARSVMTETIIMVTDALQIVRDLSPPSAARFSERALGLFVDTKTPVTFFAEMAESRQAKANSVTTETITMGMGAAESTAELSPCGFAGLLLITISRESPIAARSEIHSAASIEPDRPIQNT